MSDSLVHLPLLTRFALAFGLAVLLPKLTTKMGLPPVLGFIAAGALLGPALAGILDPDAAGIVLLAEIGKLLFMFFVGFEINLAEFNRNRSRSLLFGTLTFFLPLGLGVALALHFDNNLNSSLLIGSLIASHTLLAFPILQRLGLAQHPVVAMVIGGTIFTDIASMLLLAITVSVHQTGFSWGFLGRELLELAIYVPLVVFGAGTLARKLIIRFGQQPEVRVMILLCVIAACGELAQLIKLEGIVGAFLAGIAIKRAVHGKFVIEDLEVTARSIFIPAFFVSTGFLVDVPRLTHTAFSRPGLVAGLMVALFAGKWIAAWISTKAFQGTPTEARLAWSISLPQMAATLASAVVAYKTMNPAGQRLLGQEYVDAILVLVVLTCVVGPVLSDRFAHRLTKVNAPLAESTSPNAP